MSMDEPLGRRPSSHTIYPSLKGRCAVVTGGGSGIGASLVEGLVAQGARVCFLDIAEEASRELEARLGVGEAPPRYLFCDLTDPAAIAVAFARIEREFGPVEILVNNAGNDDRHELADITPAYFDQRIAVNLRHMLFCAQAVAPGMQGIGRGVIINLGSISWHLSLPGLVLYETAKAGIEGMTRALARDLGPDGVRVVCVVPGNVKTPRQERWYTSEGEAEIVAAQCLKTRIVPEDVAALVNFLAADDARMLTGHAYFIDAGWR